MSQMANRNLPIRWFKFKLKPPKNHKVAFTHKKIKFITDIQPIIVSHCVNGDGLNGSVTYSVRNSACHH